ncbi:Ribosomal RNA small subunit methyltransferase E [Hordeum vulgare]|nr:Ribosomal RNA small subunit methyltransferase E [Hordeum vulgare]
MAEVVGLVVGVVSVRVVVVAVAAGTDICFKIRPRSMKYHAFTCSSIVDVCAPIKNLRSAFLFFAATLILRRSSLTCWFTINADHSVSDFSSLLAAVLLASVMHCSIKAYSRSAVGVAPLVALTFWVPSERPSAAGTSGL